MDSTYMGKATCAQIPLLPGLHVFLFQGRGTIQRLFKHPQVGSLIPLFTFALKHLFGLPERCVKVYRADNLGQGFKPQAGSNVPPDSRVFYATHKDLARGLTGPRMELFTQNCMHGFLRHVQAYNGDCIAHQEWVQGPDLMHFFRHTLGSALIEAHFGQALLKLSPRFMHDMWKVEAGLHWFARQMPRLLMPGLYQARDSMVEQLTAWYVYARDHFDETAIDEHGDWDPVWGSRLNRDRQKALRQIKEHDDRAMASLDVGYCLGLTSNVVSAAVMAAYHVFSDKGLLSELRTSIVKTLGSARVNDIPSSSLLGTDALLCSIYAETLRLHATTNLVVAAPVDVRLGEWLLPGGSLAMVNSGVAHMDADFWNTRRGKYPVSRFWARRFIVDPKDPESGPISPGCPSRPPCRGDGDAPYFSLDGTTASWIPYGGAYWARTEIHACVLLTFGVGGTRICPGRFLSKNILLGALAYLVLEFDIEPQVNSMVVNPWRYGVGVDHPRRPTPYRIRKHL
ncbi:hypothetical protein CDD82_6330 [Ophiocordyceps australis]|uniref:Cytochrome P450 n=1 Tax=Ophiocordyceps australis TaxID=1399860 RepID=A0A2C5YW07_9HYPO|nr:hypothetical protein CDD82_6330 [Ophiocordyceps australis]